MSIDLLDPSVTEALRAWRVQEGAGVALEKTLATAARSCHALAAQHCFIEAAHRAATGASPAELIGVLEPILPPAERAVLIAGFRAGRLDRMLDHLVNRRELWHKTRRQIRSKMMLPVGILVLASLIGPLPALVLGGRILTYVINVAIPLGIAFVAWRLVTRLIRARQQDTGTTTERAPASAIDNALLSVPLVARFERLRNLCEFTSVLGHLVGAGVLLADALAVCASVLPNGRYRTAAARLADATRAGGRLGKALNEDPIWPGELGTTLSVSEETGTLEEASLRLADNYRDDYQRTVEQLADWLPRILYGLVVLFVIYNIARTVLSVAEMYQSAMNGV